LGDYFIQMLEWLSSGPSFRFLLKRNEHKGCLIRSSSRPESPEAAQGLLAAAAQLLAASQRRLLAAAARRLMELVARRLMAAAALRPSRSVRFMQGSIHRTLFGAGSPGRRMVGGFVKKTQAMESSAGEATWKSSSDLSSRRPVLILCTVRCLCIRYDPVRNIVSNGTTLFYVPFLYDHGIHGNGYARQD
jgi:hypothetical protein